MLIKRVTIQGFKTFAKRTEFIFDPGVTAVVGPNGSGKSNVVDAIRWCLGEQSFSLLRSKKTSDVIFSGSDQKARLGMAQVSLLLDNSSGELPIDFEEIEITRRAYRDGGNEYLLNNKRVRLQDITDLLAQTGLGRRTYALIGQGLIDKVLSLAPEELRSLFEEAAGITGYQSKRAATLRRLEAAQQNLTRVQDIIAELSPRLGYLRRQAERARERDQIAGDLRQLLRDWYGYHWHNAIKELERNHHTVDQLHAKLTADQAERADLAQQIEQNRTRQATLRASLGELHRTGSQLHREAEQVSRELAVSQERLRQLQARQEETHRELAPLRLQADTITARIDELDEQVAAAEAAMNAEQAVVGQLQAALDAQQNSRRHLQDAVAAARRKLEQIQRERTETAGRRHQIEEQRTLLAEEQAAQADAQRSAQAEAAQANATLTERRRALAEVEATIAAKQTERDEILAQQRALQERQAAIQQQLQEAERTLDRLQTRRDLLARLQREGAGYASGVRAVLQAAQSNGPLQGVLGTVASLIRVPAELDKAIEVALGGALQNVITRRWADAQTAIDYLKRSRNGRATFLPLDRLSVLPPIAAPDMPGVIGNAVDLVDFDAPVADAANQLLNRVWVVQDLPTARAALDRHHDQNHRGPRPTVVTLDGDIVRPGGAVTGGSDQNRRDDSILARERELRELPAQIRQAEAAVEAAQQAQTAWQTAVAQAQDALAQVDRDLAQAADAERTLRTRLEEATRLADRAQQAERWRIERMGQVEGEINALARQAEELAAREQQLAQAQQDAAQALEQAEAALNQATADDLLRQLADQRALAAQRQAAWQNRKSMLDEQRRAHTAIQEQIHAKEAHLRLLAAEESSLAEQIRHMASRESELSQQTRAMQHKIDPGETELAQLEKARAQLDAVERKLHDQLRRDESAWNAAQLQYQRTEDHLRQLRHDIENDLGLVLLELGQDLAYQPPLPWEAVVEELQPRDTLADDLEDAIRTLRGRLNRVSNVNPDAPREYEEAAQRHDYLLTQSADLEAAIADLRKIIRELDEVMQAELSKTFAAVSEQFVIFFQSLFSGGAAKLVLVDPDDIANSGIEIIARPPGKRPQSLALLSGGERTLTALALIFAILRVSPTPFCVLDEVDAALDEANVDRFRQTVAELSQGTQFIIITHNRRTLEGTNAIYGITMASDGTSRVISLRLQGESIAQRDANGDASDKEMAALQEVVKM